MQPAAIVQPRKASRAKSRRLKGFSKGGKRRKARYARIQCMQPAAKNNGACARPAPVAMIQTIKAGTLRKSQNFRTRTAPPSFTNPSAKITVKRMQTGTSRRRDTWYQGIDPWEYRG